MRTLLVNSGQGIQSDAGLPDAGCTVTLSPEEIIRRWMSSEYMVDFPCYMIKSRNIITGCKNMVSTTTLTKARNTI